MFGGIDAGSATTKIVVIKNSNMTAHSIIPTSHDPKSAALNVLKDMLNKINETEKDLEYVVATGYGRRIVPFADKVVSEILCHAKGARHLISDAGTIIDIGGQDSKVIVLDDTGNVLNFVMNDRCAAGTGRFLEVMANILDLKVEEMGPVSLLSKNPCKISSMCTVFAETEVISLKAQERKREDIVAGLHKAIIKRIVNMGSAVGYKEKVVFTGGVAKNIGVHQALEEELDMKVTVPENPQLTGALGAALYAEQNWKASNKETG